MPSSNRVIWTTLLLFSLMSPLSALALQSDINQPITVEADSMDVDDATGTSVYRGNVVLRQGTITLKSSKLTVIQGKGNKSDRIIATGSPAVLRQLPDGKKEYVEGRAQRMEYTVDGEILYLIDKASIKQGPDFFKSDRIAWDRAHAVIKAGASAQGQRRVQVTIGSKQNKP